MVRTEKLYKNNQKAFFTKLRDGNGAKITDPPTKDNIQNYWGNLFGDKAIHNAEATWLDKEKISMENMKTSTHQSHLFMFVELKRSSCRK